MSKLRKPRDIRGLIAYYTPILVSLVAIAVIALIPTGYEGAQIYKGSDRVSARVLSTDDSMVHNTGLVRSGEQTCELEILQGQFKGERVAAMNMLTGSLEQDKLFEAGDTAFVVVTHADGEITRVTMIDHYRAPYELALVVIFVAVLVLFAGQTGVRAVLSFVLTVMCIWKILVPLYLNGWSPIIAGLVIVSLLTVFIVTLVYGFDRRSLASCFGVIVGLALTAALGAVFTRLMNIHGAVMSYSESLLYSGYQHLNLTQIFMASIFIGSSGAMMDLAVDITSAVYEVIQKKPDISAREAVISGLNVGRAAMGTITTTLLLAYSGSCVALMMVFMAQGTPLDCIFNLKYVASEIIHTIAGSFGIVAVAPLTAVASGVLLTERRQKV